MTKRIPHNKLLFICFLLASFGCSSDDATISDLIDTGDGSVEVLILGNSITFHGAVPSIGWEGNWGMAASSEAKDYVHILTNKLRDYRPDLEFDIKALNIAFWETNFDFDFNDNSSTRDVLLSTFTPDVIIIRLGENCSEDYARDHDYSSALASLIKTFDKSDRSKVLITGNFWSSALKDRIHKEVAGRNGYSYVDFSDLATDESNTAMAIYGKESGVGAHPGDKGMEKIALRIFDTIKASWL